MIVRHLVSHHAADVNKVFLVDLFLAPSHTFPFADEVLRCKRHAEDSLTLILQENEVHVWNPSYHSRFKKPPWVMLRQRRPRSRGD